MATPGIPKVMLEAFAKNAISVLLVKGQVGFMFCASQEWIWQEANSIDYAELWGEVSALEFRDDHRAMAPRLVPQDTHPNWIAKVYFGPNAYGDTNAVIDLFNTAAPTLDDYAKLGLLDSATK